MTVISRIYYRNTFFHLGHLKTLYDNHAFAKKHDGKCFVVVDDRLHANNLELVQSHVNYLAIKDCLQMVSVKKNLKRVIEFTKNLIRKGHVVLIMDGMVVRRSDEIFRLIREKNHRNFHLAFNGVSDGIVAYTENNKLVFVFNYLVRVLDELLGVTHVLFSSSCNTGYNKLTTPFFGQQIKYIMHTNYVIHNFRYSKFGWSAIEQHNPFLLTISGMMARGIPCQALRNFYELSLVEGQVVNISTFHNVIRDYLKKNSVTVEAIVKPVRVEITNWRKKLTEYVCKKILNGKILYKPLSNVFYTDQRYCGLEHNVVNVGKSVELSKGVNVTFEDFKETNMQASLDLLPTLPPINGAKKISWLSSEVDSDRSTVCFHLLNGFYTGWNKIIEPEVTYGYIDDDVFNDLDKYYYVHGYGFFKYDRALTQRNSLPTFMRILS